MIITQPRLIKLSELDEHSPIELLEGLEVELLDDVYESGAVNIILNKNCKLSYNLKILNGQDSVEKELTFTLLGRGAVANIKYACEGNSDRKYNIKTLQHHKSSDTTSSLKIKSVLHDSSKIFCDNLIRVEKNLQKVSASESSYSLLLGDDSRVVAIPKLEIESDDVIVEHGATMGRLDDEQLFYLQSRGMTVDVAKKLLVKAFLR